MKSTPSNIRSDKFFPQLEGLRAFAIFFVVAAHWQLENNQYEYWIRWAGTWGITYFFVLSGFLIGSILLKEKAQLEKKGDATVWQILKIFYARRILRIFPIYYLLLTVLLIINYPHFISKVSPWLFLYAGNIYIFLHGWIWPLTHLWTLSVEEHFILIFPLIILLTPTRYTLHAIIITGISGILCRAGLYLFKQEYYIVFTLSSFDSLAIGALLSYIKLRNISIPYIKTVIAAAFFLYIFLPLPNFMYFTGKTLLKEIIPSAAIFSMGIIFFVSKGKGINNFSKYILENEIALFIGKIGYGLYLFHLLIPDLRVYLLRISGYSVSSIHLIYILDTTLLLALASISYYLVEKPIYSLKKHFQYKHLN